MNATIVNQKDLKEIKEMVLKIESLKAKLKYNWDKWLENGQQFDANQIDKDNNRKKKIKKLQNQINNFIKNL